MEEISPYEKALFKQKLRKSRKQHGKVVQVRRCVECSKASDLWVDIVVQKQHSTTLFLPDYYYLSQENVCLSCFEMLY